MSCEAQSSKSQVAESPSQTSPTSKMEKIPHDRLASLKEAHPDLLILDVRTDPEVAEGMIEGAVQEDFRSPQFQENLKRYAMDKPVLLYCRSGGRSGNAAKMMENMGFTEIYDLAGGILAWKEAGLPLVQKDP